jgi:hypothetical protein
MKATSAPWFTAAQIAKAIRRCKRYVQRLAFREHWPKRRSGNRFLFQPPASLLPLLSDLQNGEGQAGTATENSSLAKLRIGQAEVGEVWRVLQRFGSLALLCQLRPAFGVEKALAKTARLSPAHASVASLRRWAAGYIRDGIAGLAEHKRGRVGPRGRTRRRAKSRRESRRTAKVSI